MKTFQLVDFNNLKSLRGGDAAGKIAIGFDIDWAPDFIIKDAISLAKKYRIKPTIFATHKSPFLQELFSQGEYEFGLHPNFERLLKGDSDNGKNAKEVLERLLNIFQGVNLVRSHSLTSGSGLKDLFLQKNILTESNYIFHGSDFVPPAPWKDGAGLNQIPITWEDDVWFCLNQMFEEALPISMLKEKQVNVISFHPIHLYLNTINSEHYESSRPYFKNEEMLREFRYLKKNGVRSIFEKLGEFLNKRDIK